MNKFLMANQMIFDNVYTACFTPREYQVELLDAAKKRNIIICLGSAPTKAFISIKLIQELSKDVRHNSKKTVHITNEQNIDAMAACLGYLTDLNVKRLKTIDNKNDAADTETVHEDPIDVISSAQVIVTTSLVFSKLITQNDINLDSFNLIIIDECHSVIQDKLFLKVMTLYGQLEKEHRPRILGLTSSLFEAGGTLSTLEAALERLERTLHSTAETASDIVTLLRYSHKPHEMIIECGRPISCDLSELLRSYVFNAQQFLNDHRYDPFEMYDDEFQEELQRIPDPKVEPQTIFNEFLYALDTLGPWGADRAALVLLMRTEKLKIRTPYERHFLLLCMASSVLLQIRCTVDDIFEPFTELERVRQFSTPKVLRLIELFHQFKPETPPTSKKDQTTPTTDENTEIPSTPTTGEVTEIPSSPVTDEVTEIPSSPTINEVLEIPSSPTTDEFPEIPSSPTADVVPETPSSPTKIIENGETPVPEETVEIVDTSDNNENKIDSPYKNCDIMSNAVVCDKNVLDKNVVVPQFEPRGSRNTRKGARGPRRPPHHANINPDALCGIIFVQDRITARILFYLLCELSRHDPQLNYISVQYTVDKFGDTADTRELEIEHRNQEEVLKKFRMHECNLLVSTSILEEGIDVPRCNVIVHFDKPKSYRSYVHCKGRARASGTYHVFITEEDSRDVFVQDLAEYYEIENILLRKCANKEPPQSEEIDADQYVNKVAYYRPKNSEAFVNLCTAISLLNRYCARLPSDTFTRLTPIWNIYPTNPNDLDTTYQCSLRLPINSPLKQTILGPAMKTRVLARRITALRVCKALHEAGELDDNLMPIGKEGFRASEPDWENFPLDTDDEQLAKDSSELRPGTTKRRQYYTKRIAETLIHCKPIVGTPAYLYHIKMILTCPLPEEQNTRGRKIYPPEESPQGFGILTLKQIPKICSFPIFTRSGEVNVELELSKTKVILNEEQLKKICEFLNYMFTSVLRLQKYLMVYDPDASENSYFIVPTYKKKDQEVLVDWNFLDRIYENKNLKPNIVPEEDRKNFKFHASKYQDAVVMPWYRNQDQPQYFYVAEICYQLSPKSTFPGADYSTFEEYYFEKYNIEIQNCKQPLLDVDHTSARLNFLTPRYVNRKGVALPTSSEETKRAKRENLEHKQILVPELCTVHPFPASLWRKAVCLPCILYRINALLLADQIRKKLARDLALGQIELDTNFAWPQLDFGWSLAAVLKKSNDAKQALLEKKEQEVVSESSSPVVEEAKLETVEPQKEEGKENLEDLAIALPETKPKRKDWMEIGTWSNEMADNCVTLSDMSGDEDDEFDEDFEDRIVAKTGVRYGGSPTSMLHTYHSYSDEFDYSDSDNSLSIEDTADDYQTGLLRIEFKGENTAEAIDDDQSDEEDNELAKFTGPVSTVVDTWNSEKVHKNLELDYYLERFQSAVSEHQNLIVSNGILIEKDTNIIIEKLFSKLNRHDFSQVQDFDENNPELIQVASLENNVFTDEAIDYCCSTVDYFEIDTELELKFQFDEQPILENHPGPSPSVILQALTMSNANDGINLERLETIGDSFLKYAITTYLYCTYENVHEGKLSHLRSKQVSNLNLYRLGRRKTFGESMIATKFEPHDNWLPPCYYVPRELEQALIDAKIPAIHWHGMSDQIVSRDEICKMIREQGEHFQELLSELPQNHTPCIIPYNLLTQQSIPDKSIADCVEALIGAYLIECGPRGALLFMAWLGIRVLPIQERVYNDLTEHELRPVGSLEPILQDDKKYKQTVYGTLKLPKSPLLRFVKNPEADLERLLDGFEKFEKTINYKFRDRSYLLQSLTHASYSPNQLTDCYQRLEFLGDAVLDYLITRHLYEDSRQHSPGALTDLRSALVNNTIFASLAVRYGFHKYFRYLSPGLHDIIDRFVRIQESNGHLISEEYYLIEEDESEEAEDVEVPKALGDVFESVAGAIFLDSGMSLDAVWRVYYRMMHAEIELFSTHVPKSPIRELLELEPETAKFGKPEKLADGRRVRVSVEVFGKGIYKGIGRNYRIAKCTAAKCALKQLRLKNGLLTKKT